MHIIGIDLSGPQNVADTHVAVLTTAGMGLNFLSALHGAADIDIFNLAASLGRSGGLIIGIDAPLSYNPGGGDRPSDKALRQAVRGSAGKVGIMPPTMMRMVYLTLRGVALARMLESLRPGVPLRIVEVHPGAALLLRGASPPNVALLKREEAARLRILDWLGTQGLQDIPTAKDLSDHFVMACAAALAARSWERGHPAWCCPAAPPAHPYDFAC